MCLSNLATFTSDRDRTVDVDGLVPWQDPQLTDGLAAKSCHCQKA